MSRGHLQLLLLLVIPLLSGVAGRCAIGLSERFVVAGMQQVAFSMFILLGVLPAVAGPTWAAMLATGSTAGRVTAAVTSIACGVMLYILGFAIANLPFNN